MKTQQKITANRTVVKEKEIRNVVGAVCDAESVDLVFVVDCTGSMISHIASIKKNISEIGRRVKATNGNLRLRLAFVAYRGVCDGYGKHDTLGFVTEVQEFETFLGRLEPWGGDCPLANIADGIKRTNGLTWSHQSRVIFLIGDYPCHGFEFHNGLQSSFPLGTPGINIVAELKELGGNTGEGTMTMNFGRITSYTDRMIERFKHY